MSVSYAYKNCTSWYCSRGEINTVLYSLIDESYDYYKIGDYVDKDSINAYNIKDYYLYTDFINSKYSVHKILGNDYYKCSIIEILKRIKLCL